MLRKKPDPEFAKQMLAFDSWRVFRIISEFVDGFETMTDLGPSVSIFGSARMNEDSPLYHQAVDVAYKIAKNGFSIITGGGPGLMEAANKGAQQANGRSCGLSISLPHEKKSNNYIDPGYNLEFRYFFIRKVMFVRYAQGYVFLPGGMGTMDELFEALTLIQTHKIYSFPIYLFGKQYWEGLLEWLKTTVHSHGCIENHDIEHLQVTDDADEIAEGIKRHHEQRDTIENF